MKDPVYSARLHACSTHMEHAGLDALLLTKPSNMFYLTGDGRLCAYAMVARDGRVALGVPSTDVEDVKTLAHFDHLAGFEDEGEVSFRHVLGVDWRRHPKPPPVCITDFALARLDRWCDRD